MKTLLNSLKILLLLAVIVPAQQSCTKLEEEVYSDLSGEILFDDPDNLIFAFGTAYTRFYWLYGHKYGAVGSEAGTDHFVVPQRGGDWQDGGEWHRWHRHTWTPTDSYINHWWANIYQGVNLCNRLIASFEALEEIDATTAISELRALRAFYYYLLVDIYGNVPIVDDFDVPEDFKPETRPRSDVFAFVENELLEAMPYLSKETGLNMYGRMNYYAAQMTLAKLYMNAEVYVGENRYSEAEAVLDTIIESGRYSLMGNYFGNFAEDATTSPEHILGVPFDQTEAQGFEIHLFTLHYNLVEKYGIEEGSWNGICAQESLFNHFGEGDLRLGGLLHGPQLDNEGNPIEDPSYEQFDPANPTNPIDPDGAPLNLMPQVNMLEPNCLRQAGARVAKYTFIEGSTRYTSNEVPIFRYADVLLLKAECRLRAGDAGTGLDYVNQVRNRAEAGELAELDLDVLLEERSRELFAEGHRRQDLIRFGKYLDTRWEKPDVTPETRTLWPIPQSQIDVNNKLQQNPGY